MVKKLLWGLREAALAGAAGWDGVCPYLQRHQNQGGINSMSALCLQHLCVHPPADGHNS